MAKIAILKWLSNALMSLGTGLIVTGLVSIVALDAQVVVIAFSVVVGLTLLVASLVITLVIMIPGSDEK